MYTHTNTSTGPRRLRTERKNPATATIPSASAATTSVSFDGPGASNTGASPACCRKALSVACADDSVNPGKNDVRYAQ